VQKQNTAAPKVVLIRAAIAAARAWATFVAVTPTLMDDVTMCRSVLREALELLPCDDHQLQRVRCFLFPCQVVSRTCALNKRVGDLRILPVNLTRPRSRERFALNGAMPVCKRI
jgi:hypothetical protein